ncbi:hypothetical protein [Marinobacter sp. F3R11]|uniref:hypothetical protein n=1 Tax=Marinobacter sp. F3R11 TaxID=2267231 RepID=UPI000DEA6A9C|nr:hypothetical protein [Marinobacter sp. F3R11]RBW52424.1 hypothetical protein DS878_00005 [Marinobacter sp. F3R11]
MGRRYRKKNNLGSLVFDVVQVAARLPWWGALLLGSVAYLIIAVGLGGYLEAQLAAQEGSRYYAMIEARYGRFMWLATWVGNACFLAGLFFAIRNYFFGSNAQRIQKGGVSVLAKLLGRNID